MKPVSSIDFSFGGLEVAIGYLNGHVHIWNTKTGAFVSQFKSKSNSPVVKVFYGPHDSFILSVHRNGEVILTESKGTLTKNQSFSVGTGVTAAALSRSNSKGKKTLALGNSSGTLSLFDLDAAGLIQTFKKYHSGPISSIAFCPANPDLVLSFANGESFLTFSSIQDRKISKNDEIHTEHFVSCFEWSRNGEEVFIGTTQGKLLQFNLRSHATPVRTYDHHKGAAIEEISGFGNKEEQLGAPKTKIDKKKSEERPPRTKRSTTPNVAPSTKTRDKNIPGTKQNRTKEPKPANKENNLKPRKNFSQTLGRKNSCSKPFAPLDTQTLAPKESKWNSVECGDILGEIQGSLYNSTAHHNSVSLEKENFPGDKKPEELEEENDQESLNESQVKKKEEEFFEKFLFGDSEEIHQNEKGNQKTEETSHQCGKVVDLDFVINHSLIKDLADFEPNEPNQPEITFGESRESEWEAEEEVHWRQKKTDELLEAFRKKKSQEENGGTRSSQCLVTKKEEMNSTSVKLNEEAHLIDHLKEEIKAVFEEAIKKSIKNIGEDCFQEEMDQHLSIFSKALKELEEAGEELEEIVLEAAEKVFN